MARVEVSNHRSSFFSVTTTFCVRGKSQPILDKEAWLAQGWTKSYQLSYEISLLLDRP